MMNFIKNSDLVYRFITWLFFNDALRNRLLGILKKIVASSLEGGKKNRFSNQTSRIRHEKIMMVDSVFHSLENSIKKKTLKRG